VGKHGEENMVKKYVKNQGNEYQQIHHNRQLDPARHLDPLVEVVHFFINICKTLTKIYMVTKLKSFFRHFLSKISLLFIYDLFSVVKIKIIAIYAILFSEKRAMIAARPSYSRDGFVTTHHVEFLEDPRFISCFNNPFEEILANFLPMFQNIDWRAHICTWAVTRALALKAGDFVECGV